MDYESTALTTELSRNVYANINRKWICGHKITGAIKRGQRSVSNCAAVLINQIKRRGGYDVTPVFVLIMGPLLGDFCTGTTIDRDACVVVLLAERQFHDLEDRTAFRGQLLSLAIGQW